MKLVLYQTLKDKNNPDDVEEYGPFKCTNPSAWLGFGYYFWDAHIELAHWWGSHTNPKNYIICRADAIYNELCWDLHGNGLHLSEFEEICKEMVESGIAVKSELLVPEVIEFFKGQGKFLYNSIRALGVNSFKSVLKDGFLENTIKFIHSNRAYLDLKPAVQICLIEKRALSLRNFKIVYPLDYNENYF